MRAAALFKLLVQWIVVPIGLLVVGYYVLGPQIGSKSPALKAAPVQSDPSGPAAGDNVAAPSGDVAIHSGEPQVQVTVRRGGQFRVRDSSSSDYRYGDYGYTRRHRRHSRRRSRNPVDDTSLGTDTSSNTDRTDSSTTDEASAHPRHRRHRRRSAPSDTGGTPFTGNEGGTTGGTGGTTGI